MVGGFKGYIEGVTYFFKDKWVVFNCCGLWGFSCVTYWHINCGGERVFTCCAVNGIDERADYNDMLVGQFWMWLLLQSLSNLYGCSCMGYIPTLSSFSYHFSLSPSFSTCHVTSSWEQNSSQICIKHIKLDLWLPVSIRVLLRHKAKIMKNWLVTAYLLCVVSLLQNHELLES